jgi:hypothetical protein
VAYLAVKNDGSAVELGNITGYQVEYKAGRRVVRSRPVSFIWQALNFQKRLKMGQDSKIVPVYKKAPKG